MAKKPTFGKGKSAPSKGSMKSDHDGDEKKGKKAAMMNDNDGDEQMLRRGGPVKGKSAAKKPMKKENPYSKR